MLSSDVLSRQRHRSLLAAAAWTLAALALLAAPAEVTAFERVDAIALQDGENELDSAVIDPAGEFAYFGTFTIPGRVVKIDLETFERVGAITLDSGEDFLFSAVIDPEGQFAYFGTRTSPGQVVKIDLETFERVGAITLDSGEDFLRSAVIDPEGQFAYFGTSNAPGRVVKIDLETFERVGAITLDSGEDELFSAVIDPEGQFAYFGTDTVPGRVVKIDLETFDRVEAITLESDEDNLFSAVIDPAGAFAYFGTDTTPGQVVKIDLENFDRVGAITLDDGENDLLSAVIDPAGAFAYFGTSTSAAPGRVVKIALQAFSPVDLAVDFEPLASSDGNDVFEPGEQVDMSPGWRNNGSEDASADGILSNFVGPEGASYEIVLNGVGYGPIPPGQVGSCRDSGTGCYQLEILPDGADRPASHWDATVDEELQTGPDEFVAHNWTLHIGDSFEDVPRTNGFYSFIETLIHNEVTSGCTTATYCPGNPGTRAQMAVFVLKSLEGPEYLPQACEEGSGTFDDVPFDNQFCPWIEELADRGVVSGCDEDSYCPNDSITRAQMAVFLLKTLEGGDYVPPECTGVFTDVTCPSTFADWIEDLATREITSGCTATEYCPGEPQTRAQMAVFLTKTFDLILYGP